MGPDISVRSAWLDAGGVRTRYAHAGTAGPAIVLCHGAGRGISGEIAFARVMPLLADRFRAYAPDSVGGYGETDHAAPTPHGVQSRVDHLEAFADALDLDGLFVAGNSQGAWVAARYAIEHPDRVRGLLLIASATIASAMGIAYGESEGLRAIRANDGTRDAMRRQLETVIHGRAHITDELIDARMRLAALPGARDAALAFQQATARFMRTTDFDMRTALPALAVPTVFLWGLEDRFAPPEIGRALEPLLPRVRFVFVAGAGHQVQTDRPEVVARAAADLLVQSADATIAQGEGR